MMLHLGGPAKLATRRATDAARRAVPGVESIAHHVHTGEDDAALLLVVAGDIVGPAKVGRLPRVGYAGDVKGKEDRCGRCLSSQSHS